MLTSALISWRSPNMLEKVSNIVIIKWRYYYRHHHNHFILLLCNNNNNINNNNNVHLSCVHQRPERSHDTY